MVRLAAQNRIIALSQPKHGSFLKAVSFPVTFIIDVDKYAKLYSIVYAESAFRSTARRRLTDNVQVFLQSFSSEYYFQALEEDAVQFSPSHLYTCTYNDSNLRKLVDSLMLNGIRARIVLALKPNSKQWLISFLIASDVDIKHILISFFSRIRELRPNELDKVYSGKMVNPKVLRKLTLPIITGVDEISPVTND